MTGKRRYYVRMRRRVIHLQECELEVEAANVNNAEGEAALLQARGEVPWETDRVLHEGVRVEELVLLEEEEGKADGAAGNGVAVPERRDEGPGE